MSNTPSDEWKASLKEVLARAASDADFRVKCLTNPRAALSEAGVEIPANVEIAFSETPDGSAITLPGFLGDADEITDAEVLDNVAGGGQGGVSKATHQPDKTLQCC